MSLLLEWFSAPMFGKICLVIVSSVPTRILRVKVKKMDKLKATERLIREKDLRIEMLERILRCFHINLEAAEEILSGHGQDAIWLQRAGFYAAALVTAYSGRQPQEHHEADSILMKEWLWSLPGYSTKETGHASAHQKHIHDKWLRHLIKGIRADITPRQIAQNQVEQFNQSFQVGSRVTYIKSELEGRQVTTVENPAYIQGDETPMVELHGIGTALLDKVEPYFGS